MALNLIQERIARNFYEQIRLVLVQEGYLPDIKNSVRYPKNADGFGNSTAQLNWEQDLKTIEAAKKFAVEIFGESSNQSKGLKSVPRISIQSARIMPGDIGAPGTTGFERNPENPEQMMKTRSDWNSSNLHYDITISVSTAKQERILNAVIAKAIGTKRYIKFYDSSIRPEEYMFCHQFNYFDLEGEQEGVIEKVYSYEVTDIFIFHELEPQPTTLINSIEVFTDIEQLNKIATAQGGLNGFIERDGSIYIDLSSVNFT